MLFRLTVGYFGMKLSTTVLYTFAATILGAGVAQAGVPVPAPTAGILGPVGMSIAVALYGAYRIARHYRKR